MGAGTSTWAPPSPQAAGQGAGTNLLHPSQDDICAPPVVQGDLQADPQRPVGTGCPQPQRALASDPRQHPGPL